MIVILLCGAPHSGKSSWLADMLGKQQTHGARVKDLDIYHVQHQLVIETEEDVWNAYAACAQELKIALSDHHADWDIVVFEAPLIGKQERALFSRVVSENKQENDYSVLVWCETDDDTLRKRLSFHSDGIYDIDTIIETIARPTNQEGCDCIIYFANGGMNDTYTELAKMHCGYTGENNEVAREIVRKFESGSNKDESYSRGLVYVLEER